MKTSRRVKSIFCVALFLTVTPWYSHGQSLIRESIGTMGFSAQIGQYQIQSAIGQPYGTTTTTVDNTAYRPGFIQPVTVVSAVSSASLKLKVYPNPATTSVTIESDGTLIGVNVRITDLHGKVVHQIELNQTEKVQIDCSAWSDGTYFISVYDSANKVQTSKMIINN